MSPVIDKETALTDRGILLIAIDHLAQAKGATRQGTGPRRTTAPHSAGLKAVRAAFLRPAVRE